jgi:AraC-like DNA-binding protein
MVSNAIEALNAGLFISPGFGTHAVRTIDSYELIFVAQGSLDMFEEERRFHLETNQALLLFPHMRHGGSLPYASDVNFFWVHFRVREAPPQPVRVSVPKVATVSDPEMLTELFSRFISDQESEILDTLSAGQIITLMLCMVSQGTAAEGPEPRSLAASVQRIIDQNYTRPIATSAIARELRYNPDYLERIYRSERGVSIIDALHQKRIGKARWSLRREPDKNINEIAIECGYADPGYFRRMFKRLTGLSPREFRTLYARTHINTH